MIIQASVAVLLLALAQPSDPAKAPAPKPATPAGAVPGPAGAMAGPFKVLRSFDVGGEGSWDYLAVDSEAGRLYVPRSTRVMVLDTTTGASVGEIADTQGVHGVAIASALGKGFTSNGRADTVTVFDLKTLKTLTTIKVGKNPDAIAYEPVSKRVFAFNGRSKDATVINAEDMTVAGTIELGGKPEYAVVDEKGTLFVNVEDTGEVLKIDAQAMKVEARWPVAPGEEPSGLAIDIPNHKVFSVCSNQKMVVIDTQTGKVVASPEIGKGVDGAAFDSTGGFALSSNGDGTLSVVSAKGDSYEVIQTLQTAPRARTIVIDPKTRMVYLPTAQFEAPTPAPAADGKDAKEAPRARPAMKAGSFKIVVVGPSAMMGTPTR